MKASNQPAFTIRRVQPYLFLIATLMCFGAQAQNSAPDSHDVVMYDPLFWKEELALRTTQSRKIEQINNEFYQNLRESKDEEATREANENRLVQGLQERSQKIFETLLPKQRRKLEKIIDKTAPVTAP